MVKWKLAAATVTSLSLLALRHPEARADTTTFTVNKSNNEPLSYTVKTSSEGTPVWVTIVPQGHSISTETMKTQPWWKWGNTLTDTYLFAIGHVSDVEMILQFQEQSDGTPLAHLYGDTSGHRQIQFGWGKNKIQGGAPQTYTLSILTYNGVQTIDMSPTKGSTWVVNGHPNYDLRLQSDLHLSYSPARVELVGSSGSEVPQWQSDKISVDPHPDWGYNRFLGFERMPDAPPYRVEKPLMQSFPYIGIHYGNPNWFTSNPNPFYFNTKTFQFVEEPIVGFQEGGIYQLNSVAAAPHLDFESPFGFYNFDPRTRYAQLVIRAQNYNKNDPYFDYPTPKTLQTYRYSWSMNTSGVWNYGLTVGGFRSFPGTIHIGDSTIDGVAANKLPQWTINHPWETITLDQAMHGYTGSEGIYFYSVQSPDMWKWMLGYLDQPPTYLAQPKLPNKVKLDAQSTISVPLGFRDEYSDAYFHTPLLYASPIDHLMHLMWASGGVYHFSKSEILRNTNLDGGKYVNSWTLETIPTKNKSSKILDQISYLDGYLLYSGSHGVLIRKSHVPYSTMVIKPPTDKISWTKYVEKVKQYQNGKEPTQLYDWIRPFVGPTEQFMNATIQHLQADKSGFTFEIKFSRRTRGHPQITGLPTTPGTYMVSYHSASNHWTHVIAQATEPTGKVTVTGTPKRGQLSKYEISISNRGSVPWTGTVTAYAGQTIMYESQLTIHGGQTWVQTLGWTPEYAGVYDIGIRAGRTSLFSHDIPVSNDTKLRYDFLFHSGYWTDTVNGISLLLLIGLTVGVISVLRQTPVKED